MVNVKESNSWEGHRLSFAVKESKTNSAFVELYGGFFQNGRNIVYSFSKSTENNKGFKLEIPWADRLKHETIDMVADIQKIIIDFTIDEELKNELKQLRYEIRKLEFQDELSESDQGKLKELKQKHAEKAVDRYEFIHNYDAIVLLSNKLPDYKDHKFRIVGNVDYSEHKGEFYRKFTPTLIEIVPKDTKNQLRATMDIFFTKDAIDDRDFEKEKKVYIDGYVLSYDNKAKKDQFFPQQFVINAQKIDFENEKQVKLFEFLKSKFNVKNKKSVYHLQWLVNIFRGADTVELTYDDLTPEQKEAVEFGLNDVDDFKPKEVLGETVYENRLVKPVLKNINKENDFSRGAVETAYKIDDLEFEYTAPQQEKQSVETKEESKQEETKIDIDAQLDDLFG